MARKWFKLPCPRRHQVVVADGGRFLEEHQQRYDLLMVDAFSLRGMPGNYLPRSSLLWPDSGSPAKGYWPSTSTEPWKRACSLPGLWDVRSSVISTLHRLLMATAQRNGFSQRPLSYFRSLWQHYAPLGQC